MPQYHCCLPVHLELFDSSSLFPTGFNSFYFFDLHGSFEDEPWLNLSRCDTHNGLVRTTHALALYKEGCGSFVISEMRYRLSVLFFLLIQLSILFSCNFCLVSCSCCVCWFSASPFDGEGDWTPPSFAFVCTIIGGGINSMVFSTLACLTSSSSPLSFSEQESCKRGVEGGCAFSHFGPIRPLNRVIFLCMVWLKLFF